MEKFIKWFGLVATMVALIGACADANELQWNAYDKESDDFFAIAVWYNDGTCKVTWHLDAIGFAKKSEFWNEMTPKEISFKLCNYTEEMQESVKYDYSKIKLSIPDFGLKMESINDNKVTVELKYGEEVTKDDLKEFFKSLDMPLKDM